MTQTRRRTRRKSLVVSTTAMVITTRLRLITPRRMNSPQDSDMENKEAVFPLATAETPLCVSFLKTH